MIKGLGFTLGSDIKIFIDDETKPTSVNLFLDLHDGLEPNGFAISGFPRVLLAEPTTTRKLQLSCHVAFSMFSRLNIHVS